MKTGQLLNLCVCFFVLKNINCESVFQGSRIDGDKLIHKSVHQKVPGILLRNSDIAFPAYNEESDNIITAIFIRDNSNNGASAEIDYGGVGHTFANIHLRSALWDGFDFTLEIYGIKI